LLQDETNPQRHQETLERSTIQKAQQAALQEDPNRPNDEERQRQRHEKVRVGMAREVGGKKFLHDIGRVRPEHEHLTVCHVDDTHESKGDGEPQTHDQQNGG